MPSKVTLMIETTQDINKSNTNSLFCVRRKDSRFCLTCILKDIYMEITMFLIKIIYYAFVMLLHLLRSYTPHFKG
jgi:hypothetical protein